MLLKRKSMFMEENLCLMLHQILSTFIFRDGVTVCVVIIALHTVQVILFNQSRTAIVRWLNLLGVLYIRGYGTCSSPVTEKTEKRRLEKIITPTNSKLEALYLYIHATLNLSLPPIKDLWKMNGDNGAS